MTMRRVCTRFCLLAAGGYHVLRPDSTVVVWASMIERTVRPMNATIATRFNPAWEGNHDHDNCPHTL